MTIIRKDEEFYGGISIGQSFIYENHIYILKLHYVIKMICLLLILKMAQVKFY